MRPVFFLKNKYGLAPSLVVPTVRHRYVPALRENRTLVVQHVHIIIRSVFFFRDTTADRLARLRVIII